MLEQIVWRYVKRAKINEVLDKAAILRNLNCAAAVNGKLCFTNAGALFFRKNDDVPMPRREVRYYSSSWGQGMHKDAGFETEIFGFLAKMRGVAEQAGISMGVLAVHCIKSRPGVGSVMVGARSEAQILQNIGMFESAIPADVMAEAARLSDELKPSMGVNADMWQSENGGRFF